MPPRRIALATSDQHPDLPPDERLLVRELAARGIEAAPAVWSDASMAWPSFDAVIVRSTWDYHHRPAEFLAWADATAAAGTRLWNPPPLLRWNADKTYLRDLAARGVRTVPTVWVSSPGPSLDEVMDAEGWDRAVVKPTVSATAHETWVVERRDVATHEGRFQALARRGGVMVQPFVTAIAESGEWSLCFMRGAFSHAVLKRPAAGDFRVQAEFGGTAQPLAPPSALVEAAQRVLAAVEHDWLYARVDCCVVDGAFTLLELEMLEPTLYLDAEPGAAARFAAAIERVLA